MVLLSRNIDESLTPYSRMNTSRVSRRTKSTSRELPILYLLGDGLSINCYWRFDAAKVDRIQKARVELVAPWNKLGSSSNTWDHITRQNGQFASSGFSGQTTFGRPWHKLAGDGGLSIQDLMEDNGNHVARAIHEVTAGDRHLS